MRPAKVTDAGRKVWISKKGNRCAPWCWMDDYVAGKLACGCSGLAGLV